MYTAADSLCLKEADQRMIAPSLRRLWGCIALACLSGILPAAAQSPTCTAIRVELAALERRAPSYDPLGDAVARQQASIERGMAEYKRLCTPGLFSNVSPKCPDIAQRLDAMQANLAKLERRSPQTAPSNDGQRQQLLAELRQNRCDDGAPKLNAIYGKPPPNALTVGGPEVAARQPQRSDQGRVFTLPGPNGPVLYREEPGGRIVALGLASKNGTQSDDPYEGQRRIVPRPGEVPPGVRDPYGDDPTLTTEQQDPNAADLNGSFRTLCVRTCDGYYFPISYSASRNKFSTDADVCKARCPGTETRLFVHRNTGAESEDSVAADGSGDAYAKMSYALRYRKEYVAGCTCGRADPSLLPVTESAEEDRSKSGAVKVGDVRADLPVPDAKPRFDEDPETLANLDADFVPRVFEPPKPTVANATPQSPSAPKPIRVVGPKFFADR